MKFNWKANWEILLVLVIIVVGIVITTIAAIRNKDKHFSPSAEDNDFGQYFSNSGNSGSTGMQPKDLQIGGEQQVSPSLEYDSQSTRKPQSQYMVKNIRSSTNQMTSRLNNQKQPGYTNLHEIHKSIQEESLGANPTVSALDQYSVTSGIDQNSNSDIYEATSTEASLLGISQGGSSSTRNHVTMKTNNHQPSGNQRHIGNHNQGSVDTTRHKVGAPIREQSNDLGEPGDDTHTTRSSLASRNESIASSSGSGINSSSTQDNVKMTPSITLHEPYASFIPGITGSKNEDLDIALDNEDLARPYSKSPSSSINFSDASSKDYNFMPSVSNQNSSKHHYSSNQTNQAILTNLLTSVPQNIDQLDTNFGQPIQPSANYRAHTGTIPMSLLLGDLLKLTRSNFLSNENSNNQSPGVGRYHQGIMQQIRSLPGPLMSILQGLQYSSSSNPNDRTNGQPSHDASESNQHYHRISMSPADIHSILARSLSRSTALPAFPPPKGVTQFWISPTSGGNVNHTEAQSANADFVAGNTAGFVRAAQQNTILGDTNSQRFVSNQNDVSQKSTDISYNPHGQGDAQVKVSSNQHFEPASTIRQSVDYGTNQPVFQINANKVNNEWNQAGGGPHLMSDMSPNSRQASYKSEPQIVQPDNSLYEKYHQSITNAQDESNSHSPPMYNQNNNQQTPDLQSTSHPQSIYNHVNAYNSRPLSEIPVPLGYNPSSQAQTLTIQNVQQRPVALDYSNLAVESSPKMSVSGQQNIRQQTRPLSGSNQLPTRQPSTNISPTGRRKRSTVDVDRRGQESEAHDGRFNDHSYDDDDDSYPISVVRLDGRPMDSDHRSRLSYSSSKLSRGRNKSNDIASIDTQVAQSQRAASHLNIDRYQEFSHTPTNLHLSKDESRSLSSDHKTAPRRKNISRFGEQKISGSKIRESTGVTKKNKVRKKNARLETAGSDLMSKLLGTASTNDESEMDADLDDDDEASEKRKEEIEDAEFGIANDDQRQNHPESGDNSKSITDGENDIPRSSSASAGESIYSGRNQPRSDIEFYGHPGEETRQLKYGILGSGNYEVVNGGIYPDADESTAAVNSVANYVRKPGGILAGLPKMFAEPIGHQQMAAFMPGGRIGSFLRGASTNPHEELSSLSPSSDMGSKDLTSPLLDFIDVTGGQYLNDNLMNQLGSGSSSLITHASHEKNLKRKSKTDKNGKYPESLRKGKSRPENSSYVNIDYETKISTGNQNSIAADRNNQTPMHKQQSSISDSKSPGANQFNSYQILPSRKVTIYSDQDLDSAPSETKRSEVFGYTS